MFKSKYSTILTVILIMIIITIIIIATIVSINVYKDYQDIKYRKQIYATIKKNNKSKKENTVHNNTIEYNNLIKPIESNTVQNDIAVNENVSFTSSVKYYKGYPIIGYIKIEKTKVEYPILLDISTGALDVAVGVAYPTNPKINEKGNVVIIGHNNNNGKLFSNNKQLVIGDKIEITDLTGKTLTYTIYEISQIPETDTEYITRERGENIEISLSTCTDDGSGCLVILAKVE